MRTAVAQRHWEATIRGFALRVNTAAWLDRAAPACFAVGLGAGFAAYGLRRLRTESSPAWELWWLGVALGLLIAGTWAWWRQRPGFFREADARVLLEHRLGLDSALSAARAGIASWPAPRDLPPVLRWRAPATLAWCGGALCLALAGAWLPVPSGATEEPPRAGEKPPALAEAEAWLERLSAQEIARPEDVERLAEQARGLGERAPEERFSHSALEAADTLRTQTAQAIRGLGANLEEAAAALAPLERPAEWLGEEELGAVAARLGEALRGLREGPLAAREELARSFGEAVNAAGARSLSPAQAAQLRRRLAQAGRAATGVCGAEGRGAVVASADPDAPARHGMDGMDGAGAVVRGPGHAPLMFRDEASAADVGRAEAAGGEDMSRAALGELLGMERGEHELASGKAAAPSPAGAVAAPAQGGEVAWVDRLTPKERAALKEFFK